MVEILIVAVLVAWSTLFVFKKVFPKTSYSVFLKLAELFEKQGWTTLAKWVRPAMVMGCGGGCGCSTDDAPKKVEVQAVKWK